MSPTEAPSIILPVLTEQEKGLVRSAAYPSIEYAKLCISLPCRRFGLNLMNGSYDLNHLKCTTDLVDPLKRGRNLITVEALSAPSQRIGSGDM